MSADEGDAVVHQRFEVAASYRGPLPPPDWLAEYEQVLPGLADRMMVVVESGVSDRLEESAHRRQMGERFLGASVTLATRGQIGAWLLVLILAGHSVLGGVIGIADLVGVIVSLVLALVRRGEQVQAPHD